MVICVGFGLVAMLLAGAGLDVVSYVAFGGAVVSFVQAVRLDE